MPTNEEIVIGSRQMRTIAGDFKTREAGDGETAEKRIEGYFSVFDGKYEIAPDAYETVDAHAFDDAISGDVRALTDHNTTLVLGRTTAHTLDLRVDAHGLFGSILINPNDQDAVNLYERVKRGDVDQCSFGFDVLDEGTEVLSDGTVHWTLRKVKLYEVSVCTFPAYETTEVKARTALYADMRAKALQSWRVKQEKIHGWLKSQKGE